MEPIKPPHLASYPSSSSRLYDRPVCTHCPYLDYDDNDDDNDNDNNKNNDDIYLIENYKMAMVYKIYLHTKPARTA
jgi:hypothetical protein